MYQLAVVEGYFEPELHLMIHMEIKDNLVWINWDNTDEFIAYRLEEMGVPKEQIVLGFLSPEERSETEYAQGWFIILINWI